MKKTNIKKAILALVLATAVVGPSIEKAFASDVEVDLEYYNIYSDFESMLKKAKEARDSYKYKNASYLSQKGLDAAIADADLLKKSVGRYSGNQMARINILTATTNLKAAVDGLNGQKASLKELKELLDKHLEFTDSVSFIYATKEEKDAYMKAYNEANRFVIYYGYNEDSLSGSTIAGYVKKLKDARNEITKTYEPLENRQVLREEIALSTQLRNDSEKYTKKSFDTFLSALRLAETSVEDKAKIKTSQEYKELAATLKAARLALVEKNELSKEKKEQIRKLEEAIERNNVAVKAVNLLFDIAPKKVEPIKGQLLKLLKESQDLIKASEKVLAELKGIKG